MQRTVPALVEGALDLLVVRPARCHIGRTDTGVGAAAGVRAGVEELGGDEDDAVVHVGSHEPQEQHLK